MSAVRVCEPCRLAKAKCDRLSPVCGRCAARCIACTGRDQQDGGFLFRDENAVAQRNSQRARRRRGQSPSQSNTSLSQPPEASTPSDDTNHASASDYPWLSEQGLAQVPEPLWRDRDTRAVERFFVNWVLHPCNHGVSPGYLEDLPVLYTSAPPDSVLRRAVEAVSYADMRGLSSDKIPFTLKARRAYGSALAQMRTVASDEQRFANDRVLAALLLIDNFEMMYLARQEPLGSHGEAIRHILHLRGDKQLFSGHSFALWRIAHHRLQSRQITLREGPRPEQIEWLDKLNTKRPDIHISADVLHMNIMCAAVNRLVHNRPIRPPYSGGAERAPVKLASDIEDFLASAEHWRNGLDDKWKSRRVHPATFSWPRGEEPTEADFILSGNEVYTYDDIWLAYMWNFHTACQIVLRESLIELYNFLTSRPEDGAEDQVADRRAREGATVEELADYIFKSLPLLLGYHDENVEDDSSPRKGRMFSRSSLIFPLQVISHAASSTDKQKDRAKQILNWMKDSHGLE